MTCLNGPALLVLSWLLVGQSGVDPFEIEAGGPGLVLSGIDISPDGARLLTTCWDRIVQREVDGSGEVLLYRAPPEETLLTALFAGDWLAVRSQDNVVRLLDRSGKTLWRREAAFAVAVSNPDHLMATVGPGATVTVYDICRPQRPRKVQEFPLRTPDVPAHLQRHFFPQHLQFASGKRELLGCISWQGAARCFRLNLDETADTSWYPGAVYSSIQVHGPLLASLRGRDEVAVWDLQEKKQVFSWKQEGKSPVLGAWASVPGDALIVLYPRSIVLVDTVKSTIRKTWNVQVSLSHNFPFAFSQQKTLLALGTTAGEILLLDCRAYRFLNRLAPLENASK